MVHLQSLYMMAVENKKAKKVGEVKYTAKAKYTIYGYAIALQYWAYEAIVQLGSKYATSLGVKTPRMLSWTSNQVIIARDLAKDLKRKKRLVYSCYYLVLCYYLIFLFGMDLEYFKYFGLFLSIFKYFELF